MRIVPSIDPAKLHFLDNVYDSFLIYLQNYNPRILLSHPIAYINIIKVHIYVQ